MSGPLIHICEVCGTRKILTPEQAFDDGWDYPPRIGEFGVISPRTCGDCGIEKTLYWRLITEGQGENVYQATEEDRVLIARIQGEPASIDASLLN
jgi:hypothetical protein